MLVKVTVRNAHGSTLQLPLYGDDNSYQVEDITGLDPIEVAFATIKLSNVDGTEYQSATRDDRNIVFTIGLNPDYAMTEVSKLRMHLYSYFMPKQDVHMTFEDSNGESYLISGKVESHDSPRFTEDPKSTISIVCFDPDFTKPETITVNGMTTPVTGITPIVYSGTIETGFKLVLPITRATSEVVVVNTPHVGYTESLRFVSDLLPGDILTLNTVVGDKYATVRRANVDLNRLSGVSPFSVWPKLQAGTNLMRVNLKGSALPYTLTYKDKYGAI